MHTYFIRIFFTLFLVIQFVTTSNSQTLAGFENFGLTPGQYINDASPGSEFQSGSIGLSNFYDPEFDFWTGWAISADTNTTTPGFLNQFSAITGSGVLKTSAYAVGYIYDPAVIRMQPKAMGKPMIGLYVTNSTYSYLSMRDGDSFAKKFGGETGDDPDFLMLTFKKYSSGTLSSDSINVYLADYRFNDSNLDYLVSDWKYVELGALGSMDSLYIRMTSSDVGVFGMNTPAYFCVDDVGTDDLLSASSLGFDQNEIHIGPNPASDVLMIETEKEDLFTISSMQGTTVWTKLLKPGKTEVSVANWPRGFYVISNASGFARKICIQ